MVPGECTEGHRLMFVLPHRVTVDVVSALIDRLGQQLNAALLHCLRHRHKTARLEKVMGQALAFVVVAAFKGQQVTVPTVDGVAATVLLVEFGAFQLVPHRSGFAAVVVLGFGQLEQASAQRVVGEGGGQSVICVADQAVVQVPGELRFFAVVQAFLEVAALVVAVVGADVVAQQVIEQLGRGIVVGPTRCLRVQQVAGRIEGEGFFAADGLGSEQSTERIIAVAERAAPGVVDAGQLAGGVVPVVAHDQTLGVAVFTQCLFL
ncbi:hypothetical protein D3C78_1186980 [compost metagenome]